MREIITAELFLNIFCNNIHENNEQSFLLLNDKFLNTDTMHEMKELRKRQLDSKTIVISKLFIVRLDYSINSFSEYFNDSSLYTVGMLMNFK